MPYPGFGPEPANARLPFPDLANWAALADSSVRSRKLRPDITPELLLRLIQAESHFNTGAANTVKGGHYGPAQFSPDTAQQFNMHTRADMENPHLAVPEAAVYVNQLANKLGSLPLGLAAYHGEAAPDPAYPSRYVRDIMGLQAAAQPASSAPTAPPVLDAQEMGIPGIGDFIKQQQAVGAEDLATVQRDRAAAEAAQQQQLQALMQQVGQAPEQVDPKQQFYATLLGNLSQAMSPKMGGLEQATTLIDEKRKSLKQIHEQRTATMAQQYEELATRAHELGKTEDALKYGQKSRQLHEALLASQEERRIGIAKQNADTATSSASTRANKGLGDPASVITARMKQATLVAEKRLTAATTAYATLEKKKGVRPKDLMPARYALRQAELDFQRAAKGEPPVSLLAQSVEEAIASARAAKQTREGALARLYAAKRQQRDEWQLGKEDGIPIDVFIAAFEAAWPPEPSAQSTPPHPKGKLTAAEMKRMVIENAAPLSNTRRPLPLDMLNQPLPARPYYP